MTDVTDHCREVSVIQGGKEVILYSGTTITGGSDTLTMTLADYGIRKVLAVMGFVQTTDLSVIVAEAGTTAVASGILTYTSAAGNSNKRRVVVVYGES